MVMELSALYLPQFHQIPENDEWWGDGFTEWTNVKKARPLFRGHHQPVVPGELGYYNLLNADVREAQASLARAAGVTSFCYWHYWFAGRRLLERPFDEVLSSKAPNFPFFLGWANQSWSGIWHGAPQRILMEQSYPPGDDQAHFNHLLPALSDERYVQRDGRPVLLIFCPGDLPHPAKFVEQWQKMARDAGLKGLYLVAWLEGREWGINYTTHDADGFDAGLYVHFPFERSLRARARERLRARSERFGPARYPFCNDLPTPAQQVLGVVHSSVQPNWDNTPRSSRRGAVALDSSPEKFQRHLSQALQRELLHDESRQLCIIKSWNEWAEGNYVEPDERFGRGWLDAIRDARRSAGLR
jgi:lipopolysaccharide biosynthesis protein